jgi:phospholipid/cholesterol/gamma-HCH transport system ATP-binding protein
VLDHLDLTVARGESLVLLGGSGTGKSVLLKCLLGLVIPDAGQIVLEGEDVTFCPTLERPSTLSAPGVLFQGSALFDSMTVADNIAFPLVQRGDLKPRDVLPLAVARLRDVGLEAEKALLRPSQLSGGQQRRVALARAMVTSPRLMVFDEPTTGLDPVTSTMISRLVRQSVDQLGATALTITHDLNSARIVGDRVAMIHEGKIIWQGSTRDLDHPEDERVARFVRGEPAP